MSRSTVDKTDKMFKLEADLTKIVKVYLDSLPPDDAHFTKISDRYHGGISDFLGSYKGHFVAIELKAEDGEPTMNQIDYLTGVVRSGGCALIARTLREVINFLNSLDRLSV